LRVGAARASVDGQQGVAFVIRAGEQRAQLAPASFCFDIFLLRAPGRRAGFHHPFGQLKRVIGALHAEAETGSISSRSSDMAFHQVWASSASHSKFLGSSACSLQVFSLASF
jgi:hypothetical protein